MSNPRLALVSSSHSPAPHANPATAKPSVGHSPERRPESSYTDEVTFDAEPFVEPAPRWLRFAYWCAIAAVCLAFWAGVFYAVHAYAFAAGVAAAVH